MEDNCMLENVNVSIRSELSLLIRLSVTDIARKCHVDNYTVLRYFMKELLETLRIDMLNSADYTNNSDLEYYAEELRKIIEEHYGEHSYTSSNTSSNNSCC